MTEPATSAAQQIEQMKHALAEIEADLLLVSGDGRLYAKLIARRSAVRREMERLGGRIRYGTETPPMPGHPDWTANPVQESAETLRAPRGREGGAPYSVRTVSSWE